MNPQEMRDRTKQLALRIIRLVSQLPKGRLGDVIGRQLLRSGTSVGANYREALRASSKRHFVAIIEIAVREADETLYWLELLAESGAIKRSRLDSLMSDVGELVAILSATGRTAKRSAMKGGCKSKIRNPKF